MTAAARRGRRTGAKTDEVDALEIARITARDRDLPAPRFAGAPDDLACLVNYRHELVKDRTSAINRLHADLEKIRCGYHTRTGALTSRRGLDAAARLLRGDPSAAAEVARRRVTRIRRLNREIDALNAQIARAVADSGTSLTDIYGIGTPRRRRHPHPDRQPRPLLDQSPDTRWPTAPPPSKPAADAPCATGSTAAATASSTEPSTSPPSPKSADPAPKATPTTSDASTAARPNEKPSEPSNDASQTASGHTSKPTSNTPNPTPA